MRAITIYALCCLLLIACSRKEAAKEAQSKSRPNIVFIYTDDQTYETVRSLGYDEVETPNLDRLASEGTAFTNAYNMGGWHGAVCVASRTMLNSGEFLWNAKKREKKYWEKDSVSENQTWSKLMAAQGYDTYMTGKWHVGVGAAKVFDKVRHVRPGMPGDKRGGLGKQLKKWKKESGKLEDFSSYMPAGYGRPVDEDDKSWSPSDTTMGGFWQGGKHWSEVVKDDALDFIAEASEKDTPFFMYLAFNAPHDPRQAPQSVVDNYPLDSIAVPESFLPVYPWKNEIGCPPTLRDEALAPFPRTEHAVKVHRQEYYAIITHLDEQVGKILDAIEASGKADNTYIFFTSDHGLSVGQHGLLGKQSLFDHSIRVPLIVKGPSIPKGKRLTQDVYLQDIMAASLELARIEKPAHVEFNSFMDVISGENTSGHYDAVYGAYRDLQRMIRKDGYKLLVFPAISKVLLFDLENDPEEMTDLAEKPEYAEKVRSMFDDLFELQEDMNDQLDLKPVYDKVIAMK